MNAELSVRLTRELDRLADELTVAIPARLGSRQREREYLETLESQSRVQERIQQLRRLLSGLATVDAETLLPDRVGFGSVIRVRDLPTGDEQTYVLMAGEPIDLEAGEISLASPVGRALLGRRAGDEVAVETPNGRRRLRILATTSLLESLSGGAGCGAGDVAASGAGP